MSRRMIPLVVLVAALAVPVVTFAHGGHVHKIMGTVAALHDTHLEVKTQDGKTVTVVLDDKTVFRQGKTKVDAAALVVGRRVVVDAVEDAATKAMKVQSVQVAAPGPASAKK